MAEYNYLGKTGLSTLWNKCKSMFVKSSEKGKANGVATLDSNGNVPLCRSSYRTSYNWYQKSYLHDEG